VRNEEYYGSKWFQWERETSPNSRKYTSYS